MEGHLELAGHPCHDLLLEPLALQRPDDISPHRVIEINLKVD